MANQKAQKITLPFPPLLNLADNRVVIDTSLQSYDKINGPLMNQSIQPVWIQDTGSEAVYTKNGNRYEIKDQQLWKNGQSLGYNVGNHYFAKSRIDYLKDHLEVAIDGDNNIWSTKIELDRVDLYKNGLYLTKLESFGSNLKYVSGRIRITDNHIFLATFWAAPGNTDTVILDEYIESTNTIRRLLSYNTLGNWCRSTGMGNPSATGGYSLRSFVRGDPDTDDDYYIYHPRHVDPLINIGFVNNVVFMSVISNFGEVCDSYSQFVFMTVYYNFSNNASGQIFRVQTPSNGGTVTVKSGDNISIVASPSQETRVTQYLVSAPGSGKFNKYDLETQVISEEVSYPTLPSYTGQTIKINDITYGIYQMTVSTIKNKLEITGSDIDSTNTKATRTYQFQVGINFLGLADQATFTKGTYDPNTQIVTSPAGVGSTSVEYTLTRYGSQQAPYAWNSGTMSIDVTDIAGAHSGFIDVPKEYFNSTYQIQVNIRYTSSGNPYAMPNIVMDDGTFFTAAYTYPCIGDTWSDYYQQCNGSKNRIMVRGTMTAVSGDLLTVSSLASSNISGTWYARNTSITMNQDFGAVTSKMCNSSATTPKKLAAGEAENESAWFTEFTYSNRYGTMFLPGTSRKGSFNCYSFVVTDDDAKDPTLTGDSEDLLTYTVAGYRVPITASEHSTPSVFNILYNVTASGFTYIQGISYSKQPNALGTLLTPWQSIDENSYVTANMTRCLYRDAAGDVWQLSVEEGVPPIQVLLDDRYVIINTTEYINCIDSETNKYFHYATDFNGRLSYGSPAYQGGIQGTIQVNGKTERFSALRYTANGINPLYTVMPRDAIVSMMQAQVPRFRCSIRFNNDTLYDCVIDPLYRQSQGVDSFWSTYSSTRCVYRRTAYGYGVTSFKKELDGLSYPGTTSTTASLTPNIFTRYINGAGNNDMVIDGYDAFTLSYYDNKPYFIYSRSTQVSTTYDESDSFFVLQGQYYGVINDKLYALVYSNGAVAQMDAIIDIRGLKFLGNNPQIAFFWDPAAKTIKSFTGDGILQAIWDATNLGEVTGLHFYDETTQSIYIPTSRGLLVLGPKNNYMYPNWTNVKNISFDELGTTHITDGDTTINLRYYETEGYEVLPLDIESQFWGDQQAGSISIDNFKISLYDLEDKKPSSYLTVGVRTLTDISVKSEEKTFKITPEMWDKFSKSCLISYNPALIKGQGVRLYLKTPMIISGIVASMNSNVQQTLTRNNL